MRAAFVFTIALLFWTTACASTVRPFSPRAPVTTDTDLQSVSVPCRRAPTDDDPKHVACAPEDYFSPLVWDGADNLVFRPLSEVWTFRTESEAANANSLDEVADSAWFNNRIGVRPVAIEELTRGACGPEDFLHPEDDADGSWVVDRGKMDGSSKGFRVVIHGRKFMMKVDDVPERPSAASTIGAAVYNAVGFNTSCEQIVYFRPSLLSIKPGLKYKANFGTEHPFDRTVLDGIVALAARRGDLVRFQASLWLPGKTLGPFRYVGTRHDDPNDAIDHEDRRELRGGRVLAAWLDHFDAREQNSMDVWFSDRPAVPDGSPGRVVHYYLDTSDCLGSAWDWEQISRRLGYSYVVDWGDIGRDFVTLGIPRRPWDRVQRAPGHEKFNYFDVANFVPEDWKNEYANPAFDRMTERDAAWMARILAHFTPDMVQAIAAMGQLADPTDTAYLGTLLEGRLEKILERYLTRLSPLADVRVSVDELCATDLAEWRHLRPAEAFAYAARVAKGGWLQVRREPGARVCVTVPHGQPYTRVVLRDGVARGALVVHLYDAGPAAGFTVAGLERTEGGDEP